MKIYVASSWRNEERQQAVVKRLREIGHEVYDFRQPTEGDNGFHWTEIDPNWKQWTPAEFRNHLLSDPIAESGFAKDFAAMEWADAFVLVMPCGRSAHLELGWAAGARKPTIVLLSDGEPELMYRMATHICVDLVELDAAMRQLAAGPEY